ncbi:hypothetical protein CC1G_05444 [Coprinopsis cinerea okayama7|uniref:Uncharacterized protein n=1 Tax=Coprinopsis cinerea (strain Okayama-7 / 130 / ATCC MYA-4618 / FGSC 9003) TaxID=240176 RepID=A8NQ50_COPC7|nr:hypothetical protein CC1G_05444 [Coprinopsis cinerea okayama7\|eukprot:XP_001835482.2 hypothetical protein CC1G_05444 [Coprinopsis cinerea okayama7\
MWFSLELPTSSYPWTIRCTASGGIVVPIREFSLLPRILPCHSGSTPSPHSPPLSNEHQGITATPAPCGSTLAPSVSIRSPDLIGPTSETCVMPSTNRPTTGVPFSGLSHPPTSGLSPLQCLTIAILPSLARCSHFYHRWRSCALERWMVYQSLMLFAGILDWMTRTDHYCVFQP